MKRAGFSFSILDRVVQAFVRRSLQGADSVRKCKFSNNCMPLTSFSVASLLERMLLHAFLGLFSSFRIGLRPRRVRSYQHICPFILSEFIRRSALGKVPR
jgi:hypothetical protein